MKCESCHQEVSGVAILGIMPWDRAEGRKPASICDKCMDIVPCGSFCYWNDGMLTCKHGFSYHKDYLWDGDKAEVITSLVKRKWWSYLIISKSKHEKTTTNAI